jgi:hypothetical protein
LNRSYISGTAAGIFIATSVFTAYYLFEDKSVDKREPLTKEGAQKILLEDGNHILSKSDWENYQTDLRTLTKLKSETSQSNKEETTSVILTVKPGMSSTEMINLLEKKQVIPDTKTFSDYLDKKDLTKKIQAGTYTVYKNMDYAALAAVLTKGN